MTSLEGHECIGIAVVPDGAELQLLRCGDEFTIALHDNELMSTRVSASEEALATMTYALLGARPATEWLIGGYGMGFTLRAALEVVGDDTQITVAEIVPEIIEWARGPMRRLTGDCLDDARVTLVKEDVGLLIALANRGYDAILLDVDNGPDGLTRRLNDGLYSSHGLQATMDALKVGGILAVWSAEPDLAFTSRLRNVGFKVSEVGVSDGLDEDGDTHILWFAQKCDQGETTSRPPISAFPVVS